MSSVNLKKFDGIIDAHISSDSRSKLVTILANEEKPFEASIGKNEEPHRFRVVIKTYKEYTDYFRSLLIQIQND